MNTTNIKENIDVISIRTKAFGSIEILKSDIFTFPEGIFAFEGLKKYVLINTKKQLSFKWLQSVDEPNLAFLVTDPTEFLSTYKPEVFEDSLKVLGIDTSTELNYYCIVTIPTDKPEKMTINLQGPLILNYAKMLGGQFVSESEKHRVRQPLMELIQKAE